MNAMFVQNLLGTTWT